ncbi:unnamed protein product [Closterium sp. NIES-65]|nr:unnamed protein product [Closterium sp. NIES-65]
MSPTRDLLLLSVCLLAAAASLPTASAQTRRLRVAAHDSEEPSKALQQQAGARVRRQHLEEFRRVRRVRAVRRMRAAPASCYHPHSALFPPHSSLPASPSPFPSPSPRQPAGCALQRMTPKSLLKRFSNKLVLVFGDSISKNFAGSPAGCALQRMTPKSLLKRFSNKLVLVFGDSISKNFAGSVACVLYAASPGTIQNFRIANGNTKAYGVRVPHFRTRFASVFSNWLNHASGLGGSMNRVDLDQIDPQITDLLPLADIVVFQIALLPSFSSPSSPSPSPPSPFPAPAVPIPFIISPSPIV